SLDLHHDSPGARCGSAADQPRTGTSWLMVAAIAESSLPRSVTMLTVIRAQVDPSSSKRRCVSVVKKLDEAEDGNNAENEGHSGNSIARQREVYDQRPDGRGDAPSPCLQLSC